jgi:hypothetical protein
MPDERGEAAERGEAGRVAGLIAERPVVAPHLDRALDDVGLDLFQVVIAEVRAFHRAGADVVDDDVRLRDHLAHEVQPLVGLHVDLDREDLLVDRQEIGRGVDVHPAISAHLVKVGAAFHLDHFGAEMGQHLAGVRPRPDLSDFQHADARQGTARAFHVRSLGHQASPTSLACASSAGAGLAMRTGVALIR